MADFLDDLYDRGWHKFLPHRKYTDILTASVVSVQAVVIHNYSRVKEDMISHECERKEASEAGTHLC